MALVSSGEQDKTASVEAGKGVMAGLKDAGVGEVRQLVHGGGHSFYEPHFAMALDWWAGGELPKDDRKADEADE
jgi:predicted esterase